MNVFMRINDIVTETQDRFTFASQVIAEIIFRSGRSKLSLLLIDQYYTLWRCHIDITAIFSVALIVMRISKNIT